MSADQKPSFPLDNVDRMLDQIEPAALIASLLRRGLIRPLTASNVVTGVPKYLEAVRKTTQRQVAYELVAQMRECGAIGYSEEPLEFGARIVGATFVFPAANPRIGQPIPQRAPDEEMYEVVAGPVRIGSLPGDVDEDVH